MRPSKSSFLDSGYAGVSPHVRESNSLGFWTPRPGFRILHAKSFRGQFGFHVQVKIFRILESGLPYIGQGVVADIGAQIWKFSSSFLFATFVDISTELGLERSDIYQRMLFLQEIANF